MPTYRDEVVVLRTHQLGESDRIITMLGKSRGKIRAVAKGVRKTGSKIGPRLEPFMVADVQLFEGKNLDTVQQVETVFPLGSAIASDYSLYTTASAMVEAADRLTEHGQTSGHYALLVGGLKALSAHAHDDLLILDSYLLRALGLAGWSPQLENCVLTGEAGNHTAFLVQAGGVVSDAAAPPGTPRLLPETIELMKALSIGNWAVADASSDQARKEVRGIVSAYAQFQLERTIRSLGHLDRSVK